MKVEDKITEQKQWFEKMMGESPQTLVIWTSWYNLLKKEVGGDLFQIENSHFRKDDTHYYLYQNMLVIVTIRPLTLEVF